MVGRSDGQPGLAALACEFTDHDQGEDLTEAERLHDRGKEVLKAIGTGV